MVVFLEELFHFLSQKDSIFQLFVSHAGEDNTESVVSNLSLGHRENVNTEAKNAWATSVKLSILHD